jgi:signal transduction histidine kinase
LRDYLLLPAEQTPFEVEHLKKTNKIAVGFFWANLPVFLAVAFFNGTGSVLALALTLLALAGPTVALFTLSNQRSISVVQGITAMCMGGLLVHFGQGPLQIEMHFYFFSLLACLAVFGNPMVIVAAAVTVTLHHTVIWALIPASVFNYDASFWVVGVHASFVVVESVAAIYIARSFFDNVIGLEQIVAERTREVEAANASMRLVMAHVDQGLLTVDPDGTVAAERSSRVDEWLGAADSDAFADRLASVDASAAEWLDLGWSDVFGGFLPFEVTVDGLPKQVKADERTLAVDYVPIRGGEGDVERILVVLSDVTAELAQAAAEAERRQTLRMLDQFLSDRTGFLEFMGDASRLLHLLRKESDIKISHRLLHTLKGNALSYGLDHFGQKLHELEALVMEEQRTPSEQEMDALMENWWLVEGSVSTLTGQRGDEVLELSRGTYEAIEQALANEAPAAEVLELVRSIPMEPVALRLERVAKQAARIGERLGRTELEIVTRDHGLQLCPDGWAPFWSSFVHVVRNALDHGLESPEDRTAAGKTAGGNLTLEARELDGTVVVTCTDDGRGIDWDRVRVRAGELGLPSATQDDLVEALFFDGLTTRADATEFSGRGVGMAAVRQATHELGGTVSIVSEKGRGTIVTFRIPLQREAMAA